MKFDYPRPLEFSHPHYKVGCGGQEIPMVFPANRTMLYVWNEVEKRNEYYCFEDDRFYLESEAKEMYPDLL